METKNDDKEFIFRSKLPDIEIPTHLSLHSYCFEKIAQFNHRPCVINGATGDVYTYADVELTARKVAAGLHKLGIGKGDVIMLFLPNSPEFIFTFMGASFRGAICTAANPFYSTAEVRKQATAANVKLIVTQSIYVDKVKSFAEENYVKIICTDSPPEGCLHFSDLTPTANENDTPEAKIDPEDVVVLLYSSGTTGLPKGVMLTHRSNVTGVAQQVDGENPNLYLRSDDVILCVMPLFHIYGLNVMLGCIRVGAAILVMQKYEINTLMELVQKHKVSVAPFVPPVVKAVTGSPEADKYDLSSIRMVMYGAAPMRKELEDALRVKFPKARIGQGYGMTEAGSALAMSLAFAKEPFEVKTGSCGTVVRNAEMKIINPDTGVSLRWNEVGEICIRGDQIMKGYLNESEATKRTIDKDGWLHTGDIGYIDDKDELFIVDRLKELIKYKGFQVAPAELEALLNAHADISDAAVIPMADEVAGEVPVAFVVRDNGSKITEDEIKQYISKQVVFYKRINRVFFKDTIPKAPSGKILRKQLRTELITNLQD